ncbi:UDP-4-amino-4,6-dideoxy-N-acetyl-beta-L-altrosamine transaminase [Alteromonas sediminis]|uniref:UDP-4-amino-4, 6-dideoxy-N-acetyl-beta-L-altrosamine transaminase n=1 Tax=Alteromonas sediminis TaxID=2259342 RepID=A0A3N5YJT4_9ALTE|nr:UDP-4-amino-4,6-dideoxy-N-acetyl-beta-L-altrosamine transaminase [Alteromonas sediminis]RPJ64971.1 UDP-4-amino-4,6-dideoxy-N-acetyl-beta-L-altrosamine transaminase [Alteromonas sediminis]
MIPYGAHDISELDIEGVVDVLKSGLLTQGDKVPAFEQALQNYTNASYAVAVNSGTSALHIACLALGVENGDIVWTTPNTFVASANCARYCGADVDFVDIDPATRQICIESLKHKLLVAKEFNKLPKVLVVVHFAGHMCNMKAIAELVNQFGVKLIEDAAHALGASYLGQYKGGCPAYSDITVLSFHPVKSITTAEGGAALTNNKALAHLLRLFASHGITKDSQNFVSNSVAAAHYEQQVLGFNYRLSDVHAALGIMQLKRLDKFVEKRAALAARYDEELKDLPITLPQFDPFSAWHLYVIELNHHDRDACFEALRAKGLGVNIHYIPVHWHPYYQQLGFTKGQFPHSERYYLNAITLPLFPALTADNQQYVINALREVLRD